MNRGIIIVWKPQRNTGVLREWTTGIRYFFEIRVPDSADLRVGDVVQFRAPNLPRADDVRVVGRFVPVVAETAPAERVSELLP